MQFFLPFKIQDFPFRICYSDKILFIGSCFSEEIGKRMSDLKFDVLQNPNGILYNPASISEAIFSYIENKIYREENLFELNGLWHNWKHHSVFSGMNKNETLEKINLSQSKAHNFLKEAKFLVITLGTAFNYRLKDNSQNVANCHKAPAGFFTKNLLSIDEIINDLHQVLISLEIFNSDIKIIFTVSPVKHIMDGVIENNRSKARLIEAVHAIIEQRQNTFYFPAYELVTDVLRDYRFYKTDLVHPDETAVNFVFNQFCESLLGTESKLISEKIKGVLNALNHKPYFRESAVHQQFIEAQSENINKLQKDFPFIDFSKERKYFSDSMIS